MSSREFFQKTNNWIRFYYYATCFCMFLEEMEDSTKAFRNYLTFRIKIRCFILLFNKIDNLIFSSPKIAKEHQGKINGSLLELAYKDKFLYILPICEALCCESFTRDGSGGTKIWMIKCHIHYTWCRAWVTTGATGVWHPQNITPASLIHIDSYCCFSYFHPSSSKFPPSGSSFFL